MTICIKCKKELPDGSLFCCWCGKRQKPEQKKTRRRARGTGTISKDSRYKNQWRAIAPPAIKGTSGKCIGHFATVKEAQQALDAYMHEQRPDLYNAELSKIYDLWSAKHFLELSDSGVQGYKAAYKSIAELSGYKFRELKTADFQRCVDAQEGASRSKLEKIRQLCSQLCKYAMQNDVISKNYAEFVKLPKEEKKEKQIFTPADRAVLWAHSDDKRVQIILMMIYTGFRIGEITALRPSDIHLDGGYMVGGEKTEAGKNRVVPFPEGVPEIECFVREWLLESEAETLLGVNAEYLRKYMFYPVLAELGLIDPPVVSITGKKKKNRKLIYKNPRLTPHSTRHTFASLSAEAGMPPEILQKIIGHADYSTTADIYVHKDIVALAAGMSKIKK